MDSLDRLELLCRLTLLAAQLYDDLASRVTWQWCQSQVWLPLPNTSHRIHCGLN